MSPWASHLFTTTATSIAIRTLKGKVTGTLSNNERGCRLQTCVRPREPFVAHQGYALKLMQASIATQAVSPSPLPIQHAHGSYAPARV